MIKKRVNKINWHGSDLENNRAKAPNISTPGGNGLDGLNDGEIYVCNADEDPAIFIKTNKDKVARVGGNGSDSYSRDQIDDFLGKKLDKVVWDRNLEERTDANGVDYLFLSKPIVTAAGITMYSDDDTIVPSIFEGMPIDPNTLQWVDGRLTVIGGGSGGGSVNGIVLNGTTYSPDETTKLITLPDYPTTLPASDVYPWAKAANKPSYTFDELLSKPTTVAGYGITDAVTLSGEQTITGIKRFESDLYFGANKGIASATGVLELGRYTGTIYLQGTTLSNSLYYSDKAGSNFAILHAGNYAGELDNRYVNKIGDAMTGKLLFNANSSIDLVYIPRTKSAISFNNAGSNRIGINFTDGDGNLRIAKTDINQDWVSGDVNILLGSNNYKVLHAGNYNSYTPTLTGGGASGNWNINVTGYSNGLNIAGYGSNSLTYFQTNEEFAGLSATWRHYIICNHGNGETYFNRIIALDFFNDRISTSRMQNGTREPWKALMFVEEDAAVTVNNVIKAYRYKISNSLPAITFDKPGSYAAGIGADGTGSRIRFGAVQDMNGDAWVNWNGNTWYFDGMIQSTGNILAAGGMTMYGSDETKKDILGSFIIPLDYISNAPLWRYTWKDKRNERVNIGGSAQYTKLMMEELVGESEKGLVMDYATTAYAFSVSLAKHLSDLILNMGSQEGRLARLERENKELKERVMELERRDA